MKRTPSFGQAPENGSFFSKSERNRLIFLSGLMVVVLIVFVGSLMQSRQYEHAPDRELPGEPEFTEQVVVPRFDASLVAGKVSDEDPADRVLLESGPFDAMFRFAAEYGRVPFSALDPRELTPEVYAQLAASPSAHRAEPFLARGYLERVESRTRPDGLTEHRGWLRLESGEAAHFALHHLPDDLISDDFVRVEGLFLKLYNDEGPEGWVEGPLLVGASASRSFPRPEEVGPTQLKAELAQIDDDTIQEYTELSGESFDAHWILMEHARALAAGEVDWMLRRPPGDAITVQEELAEKGVVALQPGAVDWASVPELDNRLLAELLRLREDDEEHPLRGQPFRLPVSKNMDSYTIDPGENPARLDLITEGWIGNTTWTAQSGLVKFQMPRPAPELERARYVTGKGYFLKNVAYSPQRGGLNIVPFFVMVSVEPFVPVTDKSVPTLLWAVAGLTIGLIVLIPILLLRDRRKSQALQRELVRRRQERRQRNLGASQQPSS